MCFKGFLKGGAKGQMVETYEVEESSIPKVQVVLLI